jgi:hypothetical protein
MAELEDDIEDDFEDDDDWEEEPSFGEELYDYLNAPVKQFLINYYGEKLNNASAQTFRDIETQIKDDVLLNADILPDFLYKYRTIADREEWNKALANYKFSSTAIVAWPTKENWYDKPIEDDDDEEGDEIDESELTEDQKKAKEIIKAADSMLSEHAIFADFVKKCCTVIISNTQMFLQTNAAFDLSVLSTEGFEQIQQHITFMAEELAENLYAITEELREK